MSTTGVPISTGTGQASVASELVGANFFQQIEIYGPTGSSVLTINPDGSIRASVIGVVNATFSGSPSISGAVTVVGTPSISGGVTVIGSVYGTVNAAITSVATTGGNLPVSITGPSIFGASVIGTVPVTPSGTWVTSVVGGPITLYAPTASYISGVTSIITAITSVLVLNTPAGGQRNYITQVLVTNFASVATIVNLLDGANVIYSGVATAGGGFSASFPSALRQATTSNLGVTSSVQASVIVSASGYTAP